MICEKLIEDNLWCRDTTPIDTTPTFRVHNFLSDHKILIIRPKSDLVFTKNQTKIRLYDGKNQTILDLSDITAKNCNISYFHLFWKIFVSIEPQ